MQKRLGDIGKHEAFAIGAQLGWDHDVTEQLLFDHGDRYHLSDQFEHLDLDDIEWALEERTASELTAASHHPDKTRPETIAKDPHAELAKRREQGFEFWPNGSWARPPLFIDASLLDPPGHGIRLVEGHTRLGVLKGLVNLGEVEPNSLHTCWFARTKPPPADQ